MLRLIDFIDLFLHGRRGLYVYLVSLSFMCENCCESRLLRQDDLLVVLIRQIKGNCTKLCSSRFLYRVVLVTRGINKGNPLALDGKRCMWYRPIELEPFVSDVMNLPSNL